MASICPVGTAFAAPEAMSSSGQNLCFVHVTANTTELLKRCCNDDTLENVGWDGGDFCYVVGSCRTGSSDDENREIKKEIETCFADESEKHGLDSTHGCQFVVDDDVEDDGEESAAPSLGLRWAGWMAGAVGLATWWISVGV